MNTSPLLTSSVSSFCFDGTVDFTTSNICRRCICSGDEGEVYEKKTFPCWRSFDLRTSIEQICFPHFLNTFPSYRLLVVRSFNRARKLFWNVSLNFSSSTFSICLSKVLSVFVCINLSNVFTNKSICQRGTSSNLYWWRIKQNMHHCQQYGTANEHKMTMNIQTPFVIRSLHSFDVSGNGLCRIQELWGAAPSHPNRIWCILSVSFHNWRCSKQFLRSIKAHFQKSIAKCFRTNEETFVCSGEKLN